jgi:hypothetical protein
VTTILGLMAMGALTAFLLVIVVVPRLTARVALSRMQRSDPPPTSAPASPLPGDLQWAEFLEQWARECIAGSSLHSGFLRSVQRYPDIEQHLADTVHALRRGGSLVEHVDARLPAHWRRVLHLVGRTQRVASLTREARRIRQCEVDKSEIAGQLATVRTSLSVLAWAPLYVSSFILTVGSSARTFMFGSSVGLVIVLIGVVLQVMGRKWIARLLTPTPPPRDTELVDELAAALEAGFTVHEAVALPMSSHRHAVDHMSFDEMLAALRADSPELSPMIDLLASATEHGLPLAERLNEFAATQRARRAEDSRAHIRRMSVKANVPLVVCVLPSFILLSFTPLVVSIVAPLSSVNP